MKDEEEEDNLEYVRESIQSWNGRSIFDNSSIVGSPDDATVPNLSMSVFGRRRPRGSSTRQLQQPSTNNTTTTQSRKFCRRCVDGKWEDVYVPCPVEFSTVKCDPTRLRGVSYFVYTHNGVKLTTDGITTTTTTTTTSLVYPGEIAAVYEFGVQKYCKLCNVDGSWSSYPQFQLCDFIKWSS